MLLECGEGAVLEPWQPDVLTLGWAKANKTASFLLVQKATLGATGRCPEAHSTLCCAMLFECGEGAVFEPWQPGVSRLASGQEEKDS